MAAIAAAVMDARALAQQPEAAGAPGRGRAADAALAILRLPAPAQVFPVAGPAAPASALAILVEALLRSTFAAATYVETCVRYEPGGDTQVRVDRVWQRPPGYVRVERQSTGLDDGIILVLTPAKGWVESPGFSFALQTTPQEAAVVADYRGFRLLRWLLAQADRLAFGAPVEVRFGGRRAYQIEATLPGGASVRLFVDRDSGLVLREERYGPERTLIETVTRSELDLSPQLDARLFDAGPRPGIRVMQDAHAWQHALVRARLAARLPYQPIVPARPPAGYRLEAAEVLRLDGEPVVVLRYGSGDRVISVFEARVSEDEEGAPAELKMMRGKRGLAAYRRRIDRISVTVVGRLDAAEAAAIFEAFLAASGQR